jgi:hypothetical protein
MTLQTHTTRSHTLQEAAQQSKLRKVALPFFAIAPPDANNKKCGKQHLG